MKTILQSCVMVLALCACAVAVHADDDMLNFTHPAPSPDTPAVLELTQTLNDTTGLSAPTGRYKELADVATAAILKRDETAKVQAYMKPTEGKKPKLIVVSSVVTPLTLTFASNCAVNSQFSSNQTALLASLAKPDNLLTEVCAYWTLLNHDWINQQAGVPKKYRVAMFGNRLDITYDSQEVNSYNQAVATIRKDQLNVVQR